MKAFMVFSGDPYDGCMLVYAETANKARSLSYNALFSWDYIETSARRAPHMDEYYKQGVYIVESNEDLPEGAPEFYSHEV